MEEITHTGILVWVVGILGVLGGIVTAILARIIATLKGNVKEMDDKKQPKELCTVLHSQISNNLTEIKMGISEAKEKVIGVREDLVEIKTILRQGISDETGRYDRHSKEWKDK